MVSLKVSLGFLCQGAELMTHNYPLCINLLLFWILLLLDLIMPEKMRSVILSEWSYQVIISQEISTFKKNWKAGCKIGVYGKMWSFDICVVSLSSLLPPSIYFFRETPLREWSMCFDHLLRVGNCSVWQFCDPGLIENERKSVYKCYCLCC